MWWKCLSLGLLAAAQVAQSCIAVEKITLSNDDGIYDARDHGNIWNPPHKGCNLLPCGGFLNYHPAFDGDLENGLFEFDGGSSNTTCDDTEDCPEGEVCVASLGACQIVMNIVLEVESIPPVSEGDVHTETPQDGTVEVSIKYGANPQFYQSPGFEVSNHTFSFDAGERPMQFELTEALLPEYAFASIATIQINHTTVRPNNGEVVSFFQCIDINITNAAPFNESDWLNGGPNTLNNNGANTPTMNPEGTEPPTPSEEKSGLHPFFYFLIAFLIFLLCVGCCCAAIRYKDNQNKKEEEEDKGAGDVEDRGFQPVLQEDVLPGDEAMKDESSGLDSKESEMSKPSSLSGEDVAHLKYQEDEESDTATTPDPSGGTGSQGRHFHFKYTEGEDE